MKPLVMFLSVILISKIAYGDELRCWKANFKQTKTPFFVAEIVNNRSLRNVKFLYKNSVYKNVEGRIVGVENTNNRSPYKGKIDYRVSKNFILTLPSDLSNRNLVSIESNGLGNKNYKNENGMIQSIAYDCDGDGGWCYTLTDRLSCRSSI